MFDEEEVYYRILVPLKAVPNKGMVTMRTGEKTYTVSREVRIFGGDEPIKITPKEGTVFLSNGTDINVHPDSKEVLWQAAGWELMELLDPSDDK